MKTVSAVIAALLALSALAPGAFATEPATSIDTADARVTSITPPSVGTTVTTDGPLTGTLDSLEGAALSHTGELRAHVSAVNPTDVAVEEAVLRLDLTDEPLTSRADLAAFLTDPTSADMSAAAQEPPVPEEEPDEQEVLEADNVVTPAGSPTSSEPVSVTTDGETTDVETTDPETTDVDTIEVENEPPEPVGVQIGPGADTTFTLEVSAADLDLPAEDWGVYGATLVLVADDVELPVDSFTLTWGAQLVPPLDLAVLANASGPPSRIQGVLETSDLPGVAVVVDPTHVTTTTTGGANLAEREVFRRPLHTPDITSIAHSGNQSLLPLALSLPSPTGASAGQSVVAAAPWLAIPAAVDGRSVALAHRLEAAGVLALPNAAGFEQLASTTRAPMARAAGAPLLLPDATLSDTVAQYRPGSPVAAALAVADSALLATEQAGEPALVTLDRDWHIGRGAQSTLRELLNAPWVSTVSVTSLLEGTGPEVGTTEALDVESALPVERVDALGDRLDGFTLLATVTESPADALAEWGAELLRGISVEDRGRTAPRDLAVRKALETADATLNGLRIANSSDLNLLTESGDIPVTLLNALDHPVTVTVDLRSFSSNLQVLESPTVTIPASSDQTVLIPVEAVSTANVFMTAVLRNADSEPVSDIQPFSIRVRADWGNTATVVFTVVLVLLLVAGLIRTIRRGRKDTREEPSTPPDTMDDDDG